MVSLIQGVVNKPEPTRVLGPKTSISVRSSVDNKTLFCLHRELVNLVMLCMFQLSILLSINNIVSQPFRALLSLRLIRNLGCIS
jgi:hypothetical protein